MPNKRLLFFALMLLAMLTLPAHAQQLAQEQAKGLLYQWGGPGHAIDKLPDSVVSEAGKLTAFADYKTTLAGGPWMNPAVPLYLINRTGKTITLPLQDGHPYLFYEVKIDGVWKRAEPFQYPSCGNSHHSVTLKPDSFAVFRGHLPKRSDAEAPVRYRRQHGDGVELVSNLGQAGYSNADVYASRIDPVAIRHEVPFGTLVGLTNGVVTPTFNGWGTQDWGIYSAMGLRFPDKAMAMVNRWGDQRRALERSNVQTLAGSILMSRQYKAQDLIRLYEGVNHNAFAAQYYKGEVSVITTLARRFPAEAIAYVQEPGDRAQLDRSVMEGVGYNPNATLDQLMWCLKRTARYKVEHPWIAGQIGMRFPDKALALRPKVRAIMGELAGKYVWQLEWSATVTGDSDRLIDAIEGRHDLTQVTTGEVRETAARQLARQYPDRARAKAAAWSRSGDAGLIEAAAFVAKELKRMNR